ncbi:hypothetical protein [Streptomyces sp. NPDC017868]|uniref:hypothetical protein n=1 Tax=Streptomyces sp. NPDC017868 TaxID=3365014 RepID=UPI0037B1C93A
MSEPSPSQRPDQRDDEPLISHHAAVVFLLAAVIGLLTGGLARAAGQPWPTAVAAGLAAAGVAVPAGHRLIGD